MVGVTLGSRTERISCKNMKDSNLKFNWETFSKRGKHVEQWMSSLGEHQHTGARVGCLVQRVRQRRSGQHAGLTQVLKREKQKVLTVPRGAHSVTDGGGTGRRLLLLLLLRWWGGGGRGVN